MHPEQAPSLRFFAPLAWLQGAWARDVLLSVDEAGLWSAITPNTSLSERQGATVLAGPVLPGVVNAHSHAFQRAMAGLTEQRGASASGGNVINDDFWSWRDRMYSVALRISPEQLEHIAALLYTELLAGGYTQVCEFHYLHNAQAGAPSAKPLDMSMALVRAAQRTGMGLTLLPTLYMRSGFGAAGLRDDQQRFASSADSIMRLVSDLQTNTRGLPQVNVGVAIHSLRAATPDAITELAAFAQQQKLPVHLHIAEQMQEVQDCLSHTGQRPIEWLLNHLPVTPHWNLVHATHTTPAELQGIKQQGAAIVICPSTEANLGDGVFDYTGYASLGGNWSIGSDSHVTRCWSEELRALEYAQRLTQHQRNVAAQYSGSDNTQGSTAANLFEAALRGGHAATGLALGGLALGQRADFVVLDTAAPALMGIPDSHLLDALVFSSPDARPQAVFVAGRAVATQVQGTLARDFVQTMQALWR